MNSSVLASMYCPSPRLQIPLCDVQHTADSKCSQDEQDKL